MDLEVFWSEPHTISSLDAILSRALDEDAARDRAGERSDAATFALFPDREAEFPDREAEFPDGEAEPEAVGRVTSGSQGVISGIPAFLRVFTLLGREPEVEFRVPEGARVEPGDRVLEFRTGVQDLLRGERTALNFLGRSSGVSTRTAEWVDRAPGVSVLDTRKTLPGYRIFDKYAVRAGGGRNHRTDLAEFPMIKENHRDLFRRRSLPADVEPDEEIRIIVERIRTRAPNGPIQVEVEDYASFVACLKHGVELILIDNRTPEVVAGWIERAEAEGLELEPNWRDRLEASGGITGETIAAYARTGVRRISIGALTHSAPALDLSLHVDWAEEVSR